MSWNMVPLNEMCEINVGRTPARANPTLWGADESWLSIADMNQGHLITRTKEQISAAGAQAGRLVAPGTVVLSFKLSIGKVAITGIPLYTNEAIAALPIRDAEKLDARYLMRVLQAADLVGDSNRAAMGATLNKAKLAKIQLPIPPIDQQRRLAAILDQADALRTKRSQVAATLSTLAQSTFLDAFDAEPAVGVIDNLTTLIRTGPFGSQLLHSEFVDEGISVLGLDNVVGNEFRWVKRRYITPTKYEQLKRYTVRPGDVLISIMGTTGRCVVVPDDIPTAINTKHICAITVDRNRLHPAFLRACFLWHPASRAHLRRQTKGSIMDGLNMGIIKSMPVPVPSLERQREFAARIEHISRQRAAVQRALAADDELFASLQSRAFRGEL